MVAGVDHVSRPPRTLKLAPVLLAAAVPDHDDAAVHDDEDGDLGRLQLSPAPDLALRVATTSLLDACLAMARSGIGGFSDREFMGLVAKCQELVRLAAPRSLPPRCEVAGPVLAGGVIVAPLTQKEQETLEKLAELLSTAEIAAEMFISVNTVRSHVRSVMRKMGVSRRNEAVRRAWELGLLQRSTQTPE
jgi:DNA-binding CsgD family transcriptional regulator